MQYLEINRPLMISTSGKHDWLAVQPFQENNFLFYFITLFVTLDNKWKMDILKNKCQSFACPVNTFAHDYFQRHKAPILHSNLMRIVDSKDFAKQTTSICCHNSLIWIVDIVPSGSTYGQNERLEWFGINSLFSNDQRGKKC